jgi:hypothetical protein
MLSMVLKIERKKKLTLLAWDGMFASVVVAGGVATSVDAILFYC